MNGFRGLFVLVPCVLLTAALASAEAPRLQASHGARTTADCSDVSWLDFQKPPRFLPDVDQAAGSGNCQFHELAAQNFFALVLGSSPAIRTWPPATQVYPAEGVTTCGAPAPLGSIVGPLINKGPTTDGGITQASDQPLVDQGGRYVQYEIRVNPQFCQVVSRCQLYNKECVEKAAAAKDPAFRFPAGDAHTAGVAEVKLAWRVMETCDLPDSPNQGCKKDNLADFLTLKGITAKVYSPKYPKEVKVTLGLVGFHLMQKTATHPEFVWSTWEHVSNAPVCAGADNTLCQDPSAASASIGTTSGWSLANPPALIDAKCSVIKSDAAFDQNPPLPNCANISYYKKPEPKEEVVDPGQPRTQACRAIPCGNGNQNEIASLNKAIREKLAATVWSRYFLVGTLWGKQPLPLPTDPEGWVTAAGSVMLGNTTMETFVQSYKSCFSCHLMNRDPDFVHSIFRGQQPGSCDTVDINTCANPPEIKLLRSSPP